MEQKNIFISRTDLAVEEQESFPGNGGEIRGVSLRKWREGTGGIRLTEVEIRSREGAEAMRKPMGTYLTLEAPDLLSRDDRMHEELSEELGIRLRQMMRKMCPSAGETPHVLVVGLGNLQATPDSLGPRVVRQLQMNRHLIAGSGAAERQPVLSGMIPGVMAQTGMESAEMVRGIVRETEPDLVIAVDALAARSIRRLASTVQLTDTGIHPGSGVGNHRRSLTEESLGVPVAAVGVPTVVGAAAIVHGTAEMLLDTLSASGCAAGCGQYLEQMDSESRYELIRELLEPEFGPMYVTPQDIDERVEQLSRTVSEGIRRALFGKERKEESRSA